MGLNWKAQVSDFPDTSTEVLFISHFFKTQLKYKLNSCFDCCPLCFGTSELFWLYHTWYFHISASLLNPVGFLHSYCDLGMVIQWAEWLQCYCSVTVFSWALQLWFLQPSAFSVVIFPHSGGCIQLAQAYLIQIHTPVLAVILSGNVTNRRRPQTIKHLLRREGRIRPSCSELKPGFPLNIIPASSTLLCIPPFIDLHFLWICSIWIINYKWLKQP